MLVPKSPYFEDVARIIDSGRKVDPTALQGAEFPGRKSQCDAQGNFKFTALPAATWYVITKVNWTVGYASQGGELIQTVTTEDGKRSEVLLTDQNRI